MNPRAIPGEGEMPDAGCDDAGHFRSGNAETILVADSSHALADLIAVHLRALGFAVRTAHSSEEAQQIMRASVDLLMVDSDVPRLSGIEVGRWLGDYSPGTKVILMTAYGDEDDLAGLDPSTVVLRKPFSPFQLALCVQTALGMRFRI